MKVELVGIQNFSYKQKTTGKQMTVCILHTVHGHNSVIGRVVEQIRVYEGSYSYPLCAQLKPDAWLDVDFDSRGFVVDIQTIDRPASGK